MRPLLTLAAVLFGLSLVIQLAIMGFGTHIAGLRELIAATREGVFYGLPAIACAVVAIAMTRHGSAGAKVAAAALCVVVPLLAGTLVLVVDCLILERCFCIGRSCPS